MQCCGPRRKPPRLSRWPGMPSSAKKRKLKREIEAAGGVWVDRTPNSQTKPRNPLHLIHLKAGEMVYQLADYLLSTTI